MATEEIDPVNYVYRTIPSEDGLIQLEGMTVRALIQGLQKADPDDLVTYMFQVDAEANPHDPTSTPDKRTVFGGIAGVSFDRKPTTTVLRFIGDELHTNNQVTIIFGLEMALVMQEKARAEKGES